MSPLAAVAGDVTDGRCCGDHPGAWDTPAEPGHGFCAACLRELSEREGER